MRYFQILLPSGDGSAPTTDGDGNINGVPAGLNLSDIRAVRVSMIPATGQSFAADQQPAAYAWLFHPTQKRWRRAQDYDLSMSAGGRIANGGSVEREVLVGDASLLYYSPGTVAIEGDAETGTEQDLLVVRIDGVFRKE